MEIIAKNVIFLFITIIIIGLLMKLAAYVGERIGFYKMLQDLWRLIRKK